MNEVSRLGDAFVDNTTLYLKWETKKIKLNTKVPDYTKLYVDHFKESLKKSPLFYYRENWQWAADFFAKNNVNLEDALKWTNYSMVIGEVTFSRIATKASVLSKLGRQPEADAEMDKAIGISTATVNNVDGYARTILGEGRMDRTLRAAGSQ